ncbi:hypothetical protein CFIICLFH_3685 [Methylobacterium goesingense]|nr:hypothetical protein CFIICLFH_3685 [Methylobacterium goesingense]
MSACIRVIDCAITASKDAETTAGGSAAASVGGIIIRPPTRPPAITAAVSANPNAPRMSRPPCSLSRGEMPGKRFYSLAGDEFAALPM